MRQLCYSIVISFLLFSINFSSVLAQYDGGYQSITDGGYDGGYGNDGNGGGGGDDSGYQSGGDSNYPTTDGSYGPTCGGPKTLSGFVYMDQNQSGTYNDGDAGGISGQRITVHGQTQWTAGECDENGQNCQPPTGTPGALIGEAWTDGTGHYSIGNINTGTYEVRHYASGNAASYQRTNPTSEMIVVDITCNRYRSFGLYRSGPFFFQTSHSPQCINTTPNLTLNWTPSSGADNYKIHYVPSSGGATTILDPVTTGTNYTLSPTTPTGNTMVPGTAYNFIIESLNGTTPLAYSDDGQWSYQKFGAYTTYPNCASASLPNVTLFLNNIPSGGTLPITVDQNGPAPQLTWEVSNTPNGSCGAYVTSGTSNPVPGSIAAAWNGVKGPPPTAPTRGGPISIPTDTPGIVLLNLVCTNGSGTRTASIQLNILQFPRAYFQTTGGDVHSNETIYLTP